MYLKKLYIRVFVAIIAAVLSFSSMAQVGQWRYHFALAETKQVLVCGTEIYANRTTDIMRHNTIDYVLDYVSKKDGLSGIGISSIAYNKENECIITAYNDGCIDFYYFGDIYTLNDIKNKDLATSDKAIYKINDRGRYAYLACGFGIVVLDVAKREVKESYYIGDNNEPVQINEVDTDGETIWAATVEGLKYASAKAINLNDYRTWEREPLFANNNIRACKKLGDFWYVILPAQDKEQKKDYLYKGKFGGEWTCVDSSEVDAFSMLSGTDNYMFVGAFKPQTQKWYLQLYNKNGKKTYEKEIERDISEARPNDAILDENNNIWAAGTWNGILRIDANTSRTAVYYRHALPSNTPFSFFGKNKNMYVSLGGYDVTGGPLYRWGDMCIFDGNNWQIKGGSAIEGYNVTGVTKFMEDPHLPGHFYVASSTNGFVEIKDNKVINAFNEKNSPLESYGGDCRVYGMDIDAEGNVWVTNPGGSTPILRYRPKDMEWDAYDISEFSTGIRISSILVDFWQHLWVIDDRSELFVFELNGNKLKGLQIDENNGSTVVTNRVNCVIEDDLGHMWIGTERGIKIIDKHATTFDNPNGKYSSLECKNILMPSGDYLIELLKNETIMAIAYDGANRKWIATLSNGVFLVSADGTEELEHFTEENSPLLSNNISAIGITPYTGEIFMASSYGLCSYFGTSTFQEDKEEGESSKVLPFPNPVPPDYEGFISIKNLPRDAEVKITDLSGNLIYENRASGSQLSWDGYNMQGKKPNGGILLVFASTSTGEERLVCKIFYAK